MRCSSTRLLFLANNKLCSKAALWLQVRRGGAKWISNRCKWRSSRPKSRSGSLIEKATGIVVPKFRHILIVMMSCHRPLSNVEPDNSQRMEILTNWAQWARRSRLESIAKNTRWQRNDTITTMWNVRWGLSIRGVSIQRALAQATNPKIKDDLNHAAITYIVTNIHPSGHPYRVIWHHTPIGLGNWRHWWGWHNIYVWKDSLIRLPCSGVVAEPMNST